MEWQANKHKNGCQIVFDETDGVFLVKSLYLDTLGAEARCSPSPVERHHKLHGTQQRPSSSSEGYTHGSLSTADIQGARPASRQKQQQLPVWQPSQAEDLSPPADTGSSSSSSAQPTIAAAAVVCWPNLLGVDPGMHPKVLIPRSTNRPDLTHSTADIEGAQPCPKDVCHHPRDTNPLSPAYRLASDSGMQFSASPTVREQLLRDTLSVADIPGTWPRPKTPAARAAAARAAAAAMGSSGGSSSSPGCASGSSNCSRAGVLDVGDIDGAYAAWRPTNRRNIGMSVRDSCLDVSDINTHAFKPAPRNSAEQYKGHPQGPRVPSPVRPRSDPAIMDNSLRKFDIAGTSVRLAPRATHTTCLDVADIEGAHPGSSRDRAQLFAVRKAAAASACAQQEAAQTVVAGLQLSQRQLLQLWGECSRLDRDRSGFLSGQELVQAMQQAQVQLSASEAQRLAASLLNNAGLLDYKKLTRHLKGRVSRPASAQAAIAAPATAASAAAPEPSGTGGAGTGDAGVQQQHWQRPQSAVPGSRLPADSHSAAAQGCCSSNSSSKAGSRPRSAPTRPSRSGQHAASSGSAGVNSSREEYVCARTWRGKNREGQSGVSHWFCGTRRDPAAAAETATWRPGHAADALTKGWGLNGPAPWDGAPAAGACCEGAASGGGVVGAGEGAELEGAWLDDSVPAWMIGADALRGTCRVSLPSGQAAPAGGGAAAAAAARADAGRQQMERLQPAEVCSGGVLQKRPASAGACRMQAGGRQQLLWGDGSSSLLQGSTLQRKPRPASAACSASRGGAAVSGRSAVAAAGLMITSSSSRGVGLAERRRLVQSQQQDLLAVRQLS